MNLIKKGLIAAAAIWMTGASLQAKTETGVYIAGVSESLTDSTVYVTDIQQLDFVKLEGKNAFLPMRSSFSYQLKSYFDTQKGEPNRLCLVVYSPRKDKLERRVEKIKKKYLSQKGFKVNALTSTDFKFEKPAGYDESVKTEAQRKKEEKEAKKKAKAEKKEAAAKEQKK